MGTWNRLGLLLYDNHVRRQQMKKFLKKRWESLKKWAIDDVTKALYERIKGLLKSLWNRVKGLTR